MRKRIILLLMATLAYVANKHMCGELIQYSLNNELSELQVFALYLT